MRGEDDLTRSVDHLAKVIRDLTGYLQAGLATKADLSEAEQRIIERIISVCKPGNKSRVRFEFSVGLPEKKERHVMELKITNEQKVNVKVAPVTDTGRPAKLDGKPAWTVITGNSTLEVAEDGLSAYLISSDDPGDTQIIVKADADLGEGTEEISDIISLSVVGATAKNLGLSASPPEPK